ncbi:MAG TPA: hypothetical protein VH370_25340 [Humisphaera sp.]|jgi:PKD repeat protein|nr:hypothetical protein [Humisphaera sp.]
MRKPQSSRRVGKQIALAETLESRQLLSAAGTVLTAGQSYPVEVGPTITPLAAHEHKTLHAIAGEDLVAVLGSIAAKGIDTTGLLVDWGDLGSSDPILTGTGPLVVRGEHTYASPGTYQVTVIVGDSAPTTLIQDRVVVRAPHLPPSAKTLHVVRSPLPRQFDLLTGFYGTIATLSGVPSSISDVTAAINWGDGTPLESFDDSNLVQTATAFSRHQYQQPGDYLVTAKFINPADGSELGKTVRTHVRIIDSAAAGGEKLAAVTGTAFDGVVGTLVMSPVPTQLGIDWGDGSHSHGTMQQIGNHEYQVSGSHTYRDPGSYTVTVTGADGYDPAPPTPLPVGSTLVLQNLQNIGFTSHVLSTMNVTGPSIPAVGPDVQATALPVPDQNAQQQFTATLATLSGFSTDPAVAAEVYAHIDWGVGWIEDFNGNVPVQIVDGKYVVTGSFDYGTWDAVPKTYQVTVTFNLNGEDGTTTVLGTVQTTIRVLPVNTAGGVTLNLHSGDNFSGSVGTVAANLAQFGAPNTIDWGDGSAPSSDITVSLQSDGNDLVTASHTYTQPGSYRIIVSNTAPLGTNEYIMSVAVVS